MSDQIQLEFFKDGIAQPSARRSIDRRSDSHPTVAAPAEGFSESLHSRGGSRSSGVAAFETRRGAADRKRPNEAEGPGGVVPAPMRLRPGARQVVDGEEQGSGETDRPCRRDDEFHPETHASSATSTGVKRARASSVIHPEEAAKREGQELSAESRKRLLDYARTIAMRLARQRDEITADDVQFELASLGYSSADLGNAAGSLFAGKQWEWTGRRRKSKREGSHANELKVWRLRR